MKTVGIVCEYNPFHNGHAYMLDYLRRQGAERIVCVMSGNGVQRGEVAILPSLYRAEAAVKCGADAVFELPFPYSCASAYYFATAAVSVLCSLGVDTLAFGSECGDPGLLRKYAEQPVLYEKGNKGSTGTASKYFEARGDKLSPNDILAVEYIRAALGMSANLEFIPVKRIGSAHDSEESGDYPSASAIRAAILKGEALRGVPEASAALIEQAKAAGDFPGDYASAERFIISFLRRSDPEILAGCAECGGGVSMRLCGCADNFDGSTPFRELVATKKYTDARLRRAAMFAFAGVKTEDISRRPAYVRLLAANSVGREIAGNACAIPVVTKISEIPNTPEALRQKELSLKLDSLFTMVLPRIHESGYFMKLPPRIV